MNDSLESPWRGSRQNLLKTAALGAAGLTGGARLVFLSMQRYFVEGAKLCGGRK